MKYFVRHLFVGVMVLALAGLMALGKDKTKRVGVTFPMDVTVGGTLVKQGDYDLKFNEQTGEVAILKGSKIVAKTMGHLQELAGESHGASLHLKDNELISVTLGDRQEVVMAQANSTGSEQ